MKIIWVLFQISIVPLVLLLLKVLRVRIIFENEVPPERGCLIISNHECKLDPFFILNAYGFRKNMVNIPFQFPVVHQYMEMGLLSKIISLFGGFSVGKTLEEKAKSLFYMRSVLEKKGSILIFPEGKLIKKNHDFRNFQKGYTFLMTKDTQIILSRIENFHRLQHHFFLKTRPIIRFKTIKSGTSKEEVLEIIKNFYSSYV